MISGGWYLCIRYSHCVSNWPLSVVDMAANTVRKETRHKENIWINANVLVIQRLCGVSPGSGYLFAYCFCEQRDAFSRDMNEVKWFTTSLQKVAHAQKTDPDETGKEEYGEKD